MTTTSTALLKAEQGIEQSSRTAGEIWLVEATKTLKQLLINNPTFFCDEIWETGLDRGCQPKALGGVIRRALNDGWIEEILHSQGVVSRKSKSSNMQLKRVWKSNLYRGGVETT